MAKKTTSRSIILTGTEQTDEVGRILHAGPLSVELDGGNLRYLRLNGIEVLRAIAFLVRDENWGTYVPAISDMTVSQRDDGFSVAYEAICSRAGQSISYAARIEGRADGSLDFHALGMPQTDFLTARTGFVVLHPLDGVVGHQLKVEHVDGSITQSEFPEQVNPDCPFRNIRTLSHEVQPGLWVQVTMEGDAYEMEDHRNWTDASFKTYIRPLSKPWPYTLAQGELIEQSVTFSFKGPLPKAGDLGGTQSNLIKVGSVGTERIPPIGLGVPPEEVDAALAKTDLMKLLAPKFLACAYDPRLHHGVELLRKYRDIASHINAEVMLEVVVQSVNEYENELMGVAAQVRQAGLKLESVAVCPVGHLKAVLPGGIYPPAPELDDLYRAARAAFPEIRLGGGMFSFFTELNRKRPPSQLLDYITNTTSPIVHAADDRSVMETLEALPWQIKTARRFSNGTPHRVGPSGIGARDNPHGSTYSQNPENERICLAKMDPRQRGLFSAAWTLAYVAELVAGGVDRISMAAPTGPLGVIYRGTDYHQPYYDDLPEAIRTTAVYPAFHVLSTLNCASGSKLRPLSIASADKAAALAWENVEGRWLLVANLTAAEQTMKLSGVSTKASVGVLDAASFAEASSAPISFRERSHWLAPSGDLVLDAYAVACIFDQ
jgi:hypothetical protein